MGEDVRSRIQARWELPLPELDATIPLPADLPVAGGWGYHREEPCIITDEREPDPDSDAAQGRDHAIFFIRERLLLELGAMEFESRLARVSWRVRTEELIRDADGKPALDHFEVELAGLLDEGVGEPAPPRFRNVCTFWFDVSRVRGIPDDADMSMMCGGGRFEASHDE